ncbi:hypothetical protein, partial [Rhodoblastus sp.]|uniref:hypothetical protein n=1 Tax=Rhodoblastus sp. TaxID=1962975 RepID=UPI003F9B4E2E
YPERRRKRRNATAAPAVVVDHGKPPHSVGGDQEDGKRHRGPDWESTGSFYITFRYSYIVFQLILVILARRRQA